MTIADLIRKQRAKNGPGGVATAIPAIPAIPEGAGGGAVAKIATIAVAPPADDRITKTTYHGFTLAELKAEATDDWQEIQNAPRQLEAFAKSLAQRRDMANGKVPNHYTKAAECTHCGPVWLWEDAPDVVMGCPWCFVRVAGKPIPRPQEYMGG